MHKIIKFYFVDLFSLWAVNQVAAGMVFQNGYKTFLITAFGLTVASILGKPVINLLLLPLNLATFGMFKWLSSAIALYLVTLVVKEFDITRFSFAGYYSKWFDIPAINVNNVLAFVGFALLLSIISSILHWIVK